MLDEWFGAQLVGMQQQHAVPHMDRLPHGGVCRWGNSGCTWNEQDVIRGADRRTEL
jgi:hypothetical protein